MDPKKVSTFVGGGHSYSIAARMSERYVVRSYHPDSNIVFPSEHLTATSNLIISDHFWTHQAAELQASSLMEWLEHSTSRLLFIAGHNDLNLLSTDPKMFPLEFQSQAPNGHPVPLQWNENRLHLAGSSFPFLRNTWSVSPLSNLEVVAANADDGSPVILRRHFESGSAATLVLGSMNLPAAIEWLTHPAFLDLLEYLLDPQDSSLHREEMIPESAYPQYDIVTNEGLTPLADVLHMATIQGRPDVHGVVPQQGEGAARAAMRYAVDPRTEPRIVGDLCRAARRLGIAGEDLTSVLYSQRLLLDTSRAGLTGGLPFVTEEYWKTGIRHWIDRATHTTAPLVELLPELRLLLAEPAGDGIEAYKVQLRRWVEALESLNVAAAHGEPVEMRSKVLYAASHLESQRVEGGKIPRLTVAAYAAKFASEVINGGPLGAAEQAESYMAGASNHLAASGDKVVAESYAVLRDVILGFYESGHSLKPSRLQSVREPFARTLVSLVVRLKDEIQDDPLSILDVFNDCDRHERVRFVESLKTASRFHKEGDPLQALLAINKSIVKDPCGGLDFADPEDGPQRLNWASTAYEVLETTRTGVYTGAVEPHEIWPRYVVESRKEAYLRSCPDYAATIHVSAQSRSLRISTLTDSAGGFDLVHVGGWWHLEPQLDIARLRLLLSEIGGENLSETLLVHLLGTLGDAKCVAESPRWRWHGAAIFAFPDSITHDSALEGLSRSEYLPDRLLDALDCSELAAGLSIDGATFIDLERNCITAFGTHLPVSKEQSNAVAKDQPLLRYRGARHRSAAGFAASNPGSLAFVMSEDGGCLAMGCPLSGQLGVERIW